MKGKIFKTSVALLLILTMTMANFIFVGESLISYAMDAVATATNSNNVEFAAFFKDDSGNVQNTLERNSKAEDTKLYLQVNVLKDGYFNGSISLNSANFDLISSNSNFVNKIENNVITLNQMAAGTSETIEVNVALKRTEKIDVTSLSAKSILTLSGVYKDSTEKDVQINSEREVTLKLVSDTSAEKLKNEVSLLTNQVLNVNGEERRVVQFSVKLGLNDNNYPMNAINAEVNIPDINDKQPIEIQKIVKLNEMTKCEITENEKKLTISMSNTPEENISLWKTSGYEEVILTYIYEKDADTTGMKITSNEIMTLFDGNSATATVAELTVDTEKNSIVTGSIANVEKEIYKGGLYSGSTEEITSNSTVEVSLGNVASNLNIYEENLLVNAEDEAAGQGHTSKIITTQMFINRESLFTVIGDNGTVSVVRQDGTEIMKIDQTTPVDDNGDIVVSIENGTEAPIIKTSTAINAGKINIITKKVLSAVEKSDLKINTNLKVDSNLNEAGANVLGQAVTELKESTTEASLTVNKTSLSTVSENKNVDITAVLKSNSKQYDLYKNPEIMITLPEDVTDIKVNSTNKIYGDEFTLTIAKGVVNSRIVLDIKLTGTQTTYKEVGIEGTTIVINADLTLDKKATSKDATFDMTYTNQNANQYKDGKAQGEESIPISIVSPKGIISINNIEDLGINTIGEEKLTTSKLSRNSATQTLKIQSEVINNNENPVSGLTIVGNFGTDGKVIVDSQEKQENLGVQVKSGISVEGIDSSKLSVYYTENESATADVNNKENGWTTSITDGSKVRKYMIVATDMVIGESIDFAYDIEVPANLTYNKQAYLGYTTTYTDTVTGAAGTVDSTYIGLETGTGPIAEISLGASANANALQTNAKAKQYDVLTYTIKVSNTGTETLNNATVTGNVPDGTTLVENSDAADENTRTYEYTELPDKTVTFTIDNLAAGESTEESYTVRINKDTAVGTKIVNTVNIQYDGETKTSNEFITEVEKATLIINVKGRMASGVRLTVGDFGDFYATIENLTDTEYKDVKFEWVLPSGIKLYEQNVYDAEEYDDPAKAEEKPVALKTTDGTSVTIDSIPANGKVYINAVVEVTDVEENQTYKDIYAKLLTADNEEIYSNKYETAVLDTQDFEISLSANDENAYKKYDEAINYTIVAKNKATAINSTVDLTTVVEDKIPDILQINEVLVNGESIDISGIENNNVSIILSNFVAGSTATIEIKTTVAYNEDTTEEEKISNTATLIEPSGVTIESNTINHIIEETNIELLPDGSKAHKVNGTAWIDSNGDGKMDDSEEKLSGITVKLLNIESNTVQKDYEDQEISAVTDANGYYTLSRISAGNYLVVFEYDTNNYILATYKANGVDESVNSDVVNKTLNINGTEAVYAITDNIDLTTGNASNVNIGLEGIQAFDMKLDKFVNKITVQNSAGTTTYNYNNETLAKIELDSKRVANSNVIIEYSIVVSNVGEMSGYVKNIVDYLPSDLKFSSELNKDWYQSNGNLYSSSLANTKIAAGESKTITLILTKTMTEDNTGRINNTAEIAESYNEAGTPDINSTAANKAQGENDMGAADVIISIRTGAAITYTAIILSTLVVVAAGIYFIRRKVIEKNI